jgi:hypothetical protein
MLNKKLSFINPVQPVERSICSLSVPDIFGPAGKTSRQDCTIYTFPAVRHTNGYIATVAIIVIGQNLYTGVLGISVCTPEDAPNFNFRRGQNSAVGRALESVFNGGISDTLLRGLKFDLAITDGLKTLFLEAAERAAENAEITGLSYAIRKLLRKHKNVDKQKLFSRCLGIVGR